MLNKGQIDGTLGQIKATGPQNRIYSLKKSNVKLDPMTIFKVIMVNYKLLNITKI